MQSKVPTIFISAYVVLGISRHIWEHPFLCGVSGLLFIYAIYLSIRQILTEFKKRKNQSYKSQPWLSPVIYIVLSLLGLGILISESLDRLAFP